MCLGHTAQDVARAITEFQGVNLWDLRATHGRMNEPLLAWGLHENCAQRIKGVLDPLAEEMAHIADASDRVQDLEQQRREGRGDANTIDEQLTVLKAQLEMLLNQTTTAAGGGSGGGAQLRFHGTISGQEGLAYGQVVSEVQRANALCTLNHNAQGNGSWFTTWKTKLWQASGAIVFFSDKYRNRFTEPLRWEAGAILRIRRDRPDFKLFVFDPHQHEATAVRANILDGVANMGDVSGWERFVTTKPDVKPKWVDDEEVGLDPDYRGRPADPDAETSEPAVDAGGGVDESKG